MKFYIGDRVQRLSDINNKDSPMLTGTVVRAYRLTSLLPEVYDVIWDSDATRIDEGFLLYGLEHETNKRTK